MHLVSQNSGFAQQALHYGAACDGGRRRLLLGEFWRENPLIRVTIGNIVLPSCSAEIIDRRLFGLFDPQRMRITPAAAPKKQTFDLKKPN